MEKKLIAGRGGLGDSYFDCNYITIFTWKACFVQGLNVYSAHIFYCYLYLFLMNNGLLQMKSPEDTNVFRFRTFFTSLLLISEFSFHRKKPVDIAGTM
jgi:hypothetical protein